MLLQRVRVFVIFFIDNNIQSLTNIKWKITNHTLDKMTKPMKHANRWDSWRKTVNILDNDAKDNWIWTFSIINTCESIQCSVKKPSMWVEHWIRRTQYSAKIVKFYCLIRNILQSFVKWKITKYLPNHLNNTKFI